MSVIPIFPISHLYFAIWYHNPMRKKIRPYNNGKKISTFATQLPITKYQIPIIRELNAAVISERPACPAVISKHQ
jgi:hypothetical protein